MIVSLIAAMARNRVIGNKNKLPWKLPADMQHFHNSTIGKPVIMGSVTYESIGRPLPRRTNIVLSLDPNYRAPGCDVVRSISEALRAAKNAPEVMIIGGSSIYHQFLALADRIYLTVIDANFEGDTFFPEFDLTEWQETRREPHEPDTENPYHYTFFTYDRHPKHPAPQRLARTTDVQKLRVQKNGTTEHFCSGQT